MKFNHSSKIKFNDTNIFSNSNSHSSLPKYNNAYSTLLNKDKYIHNFDYSNDKDMQEENKNADNFPPSRMIKVNTIKSTLRLKDKIFSPGDDEDYSNNVPYRYDDFDNINNNLPEKIPHERERLMQNFSISPSNFNRKSLDFNKELSEALPNKTLILDLDETLVHSSLKPIYFQSDFQITVNFAKERHNICVLKRPYLDEFLYKMSKIFTIVIFTASIPSYANPLLDLLDKHKVISRRFFRKDCISSNGLFIKDLKILRKDLKDLIIIDNNPKSYSLNRENGVPIKTWHYDKSDMELKKLIPFLVYLSNVDDVRDVITRVVINNEVNFDCVNKMVNELKLKYKEKNDYSKVNRIIHRATNSAIGLNNFTFQINKNRTDNGNSNGNGNSNIDQKKQYDQYNHKQKIYKYITQSKKANKHKDDNNTINNYISQNSKMTKEDISKKELLNNQNRKDNINPSYIHNNNNKYNNTLKRIFINYNIHNNNNNQNQNQNITNSPNEESKNLEVKRLFNRNNSSKFLSRQNFSMIQPQKTQINYKGSNTPNNDYQIISYQGYNYYNNKNNNNNINEESKQNIGFKKNLSLDKTPEIAYKNTESTLLSKILKPGHSNVNKGENYYVKRRMMCLQNSFGNLQSLQSNNNKHSFICTSSLTPISNKSFYGKNFNNGINNYLFQCNRANDRLLGNSSNYNFNKSGFLEKK